MSDQSQARRSGRRLRQNVFWNFGGQAWAVALALFATPYIVHQLGTDSYGLLMTVGVVTSYFWFSDLGLGQATIKYIAEHAARREWKDVTKIFWTSVTCYVIFGVIAAIILVIITPLLVHRLFRIPPELQETALRVFYVSATGFMVGMINNAPSSIPRGLQRFDISNKVSILVVTAQTVLTVGVLATGHSIFAIVLGNLVVGVVALFVNTIIAVRLLPELRRPSADTATLRKLAGFGGFVAVSALLVPFLGHIEKLIIANWISIGAVTYYTIPFNVATKLLIIPSAIIPALFPLFSSLSSSGGAKMGVDVYLRTSRYMLLLLMPAVLAFVVVGEEFLELWLGPEFARQSAAPLRVLAVAMLLYGPAWNSFNLLQAWGRPDLTAKFHVAELAIHVPTTFFCVYQWSVTGAAVAWLLRVVVDLIFQWAGVAKVTGVDWRLLARTLVNHSVAAVLFAGLFLGVLKSAVEGMLPTYALLICFGSAALLMACVCGWVWGMKDDERDLVLRRFGRLQTVPIAKER